MRATAACSRILPLAQQRPRFGTVHSVFDRAVNLELGEAGLIGLIAEDKTLTPYAVSVRTEQPFFEAGVRAGMAAHLENGTLRIPQAQIEIDLTHAAPVELCVDAIGLRGRAGERMLWEAICGALADADTQEGLAPLATGAQGNVYARFLTPRLERLCSAVEQGAQDEAVQAAAACAGCGMGLTPSSDDLLCGYFLTLHLLFRARGISGANAHIRRMARAAAARTNRISATFLLQSGDALANAALCALFEAAFTDLNGAAASRAIGRVLAIGSTSGADTLTGVALALRQHNGGNEAW